MSEFASGQGRSTTHSVHLRLLGLAGALGGALMLPWFSGGISAAQAQYPGTCPDKFQGAPAALDPKKDKNANGFICFKPNGNGTKLNTTDDKLL